MRAPRGMLELQAWAGHPPDRSPAVDRPLGFHPSRPSTNGALGHTPSRLPTIHLSKNLFNTAANQLRFGVVMASGGNFFYRPPAVSSSLPWFRITRVFRSGEGNNSVPSPPVNATNINILSVFLLQVFAAFSRSYRTRQPSLMSGGDYSPRLSFGHVPGTKFSIETAILPGPRTAQ